MSVINYSNLKRLPKLVAFDLDGTIWTPDMYMLSGGSPFSVVDDGTRELRDRRGDPVKLIGESGRILHDLKYNELWSGVRVAWVSRCDEPSWADECLKKFRSCPEQLDPLHTLAHSSHIYKANKKEHFRRLQQEFPDVGFKDMIFYDNEYSNITSVGSLGVHSVYCPDGMTRRVWEESLVEFASKDRSGEEEVEKRKWG